LPFSTPALRLPDRVNRIAPELFPVIIMLKDTFILAKKKSAALSM